LLALLSSEHGWERLPDGFDTPDSGDNKLYFTVY
jgi:rubredoxin